MDAMNVLHGGITLIDCMARIHGWIVLMDGMEGRHGWITLLDCLEGKVVFASGVEGAKGGGRAKEMGSITK